MKARHSLVLLTGAVWLTLVLTGCPARQPGDASTGPAPGARPEPAGAALEIELIEPRPAPQFTLKTPGGGEVSLSDYAGKVLVLDFWSTSCTACIEELPEYQRMYDSWDHDRVEYLGVSLDTSIGVVEGFLAKRRDLSLPMALGDEQMLDAYLGARRTIPAARVIDAEGMLRYEPPPGKSAAKVAAAVERLLAKDEAGASE
ncbi:MAG: peroxiredoxin family protein [Armatimonadota bacterium]